MSSGDIASCQILQVTEPAHRSRAVEALLRREIIAVAFNGIYILAGNADDPSVPQKIAAAKGRPRVKGAALVCSPEFLAEHVALDDPVLQSTYPFDRILDLYGAVHALGLILPAAVPGAPPHIVQAGTVLNVWTEQQSQSPLRSLILELRRAGLRALAGTSANLAGRPTITDAAEVRATFASRVPLMLLDAFDPVPPNRRHSASIVDLTGQTPRLVREGSVPARELSEELRRRQLGELGIGPDVQRV